MERGRKESGVTEVHILSLVEVLPRPWPGLGLPSGAQLNAFDAEFQIHRLKLLLGQWNGLGWAYRVQTPQATKGLLLGFKTRVVFSRLRSEMPHKTRCVFEDRG